MRVELTALVFDPCAKISARQVVTNTGAFKEVDVGSYEGTDLEREDSIEASFRKNCRKDSVYVIHVTRREPHV